ncbi:MAG: response regulator [Acidobacteriota bacterium]|jgi:two-component system alkaline phosphatase synthesis response regulator PhoP
MAKTGGKTILVVDDEPNVRLYLQSILEDAGFSVLTAGDGEEALRIIKEKHPDFISLDLVMPRKSGHKLLYELRKDSDLSQIPVLIVTAHARDEMGQEDLDDLLENRIMSGPGTYLEKPVSPDAYVHAIRRALGIDESSEASEQQSLKDQLTHSLQSASPEAMRRALDAISRTPKE